MYGNQPQRRPPLSGPNATFPGVRRDNREHADGLHGARHPPTAARRGLSPPSGVRWPTDSHGHPVQFRDLKLDQREMLCLALLGKPMRWEKDKVRGFLRRVWCENPATRNVPFPELQDIFIGSKPMATIGCRTPVDRENMITAFGNKPRRAQEYVDAADATMEDNPVISLERFRNKPTGDRPWWEQGQHSGPPSSNPRDQGPPSNPPSNPPHRAETPKTPMTPADNSLVNGVSSPAPARVEPIPSPQVPQLPGLPNPRPPTRFAPFPRPPRQSPWDQRPSTVADAAATAPHTAAVVASTTASVQSAPPVMSVPVREGHAGAERAKEAVGTPKAESPAKSMKEEGTADVIEEPCEWPASANMMDVPQDIKTRLCVVVKGFPKEWNTIALERYIIDTCAQHMRDHPEETSGCRVPEIVHWWHEQHKSFATLCCKDHESRRIFAKLDHLAPPPGLPQHTILIESWHAPLTDEHKPDLSPKVDQQPKQRPISPAGLPPEPERYDGRALSLLPGNSNTVLSASFANPIDRLLTRDTSRGVTDIRDLVTRLTDQLQRTDAGEGTAYVRDFLRRAQNNDPSTLPAGPLNQDSFPFDRVSYRDIDQLEEATAWVRRGQALREERIRRPVEAARGDSTATLPELSGASPTAAESAHPASSKGVEQPPAKGFAGGVSLLKKSKTKSKSKLKLVNESEPSQPTSAHPEAEAAVSRPGEPQRSASDAKPSRSGPTPAVPESSPGESGPPHTNSPSMRDFQEPSEAAVPASAGEDAKGKGHKKRKHRDKAADKGDDDNRDRETGKRHKKQHKKKAKAKEEDAHAGDKRQRGDVRAGNNDGGDDEDGSRINRRNRRRVVDSDEDDDRRLPAKANGTAAAKDKASSPNDDLADVFGHDEDDAARNGVEAGAVRTAT